MTVSTRTIIAVAHDQGLTTLRVLLVLLASCRGDFSGSYIHELAASANLNKGTVAKHLRALIGAGIVRELPSGGRSPQTPRVWRGVVHRSASDGWIEIERHATLDNVHALAVLLCCLANAETGRFVISKCELCRTARCTRNTLMRLLKGAEDRGLARVRKRGWGVIEADVLAGTLCQKTGVRSGGIADCQPSRTIFSARPSDRI